MKIKTYLTLGFLVISLSSCRNCKDDCDVASTRFVHKYGFDTSKKEWEKRGKEGQVITAFKNGVTKTSSYKNGILHGKTTFTYPSSTMIQELLEYNNGILIKQVAYELSGLPIRETIFQEDKKRVISWNKNGIPLSIEEYKNDLLWSSKYFNERNEVESSVIEGIGTRIKRNRENLLLSKEKVENGQITHRKTFHPNGQLKSKSSFSNYELHGVQETFSPSGNLLTHATWSYGKLDGMLLGYRNDKKYFEIPYINGKKHGVERHFSKHGELAKEVHWDNNIRHGSSREHNEDFTDVQWYWRGIAVDLKRYQMLKFREELIAEINNGKKPKIKETEAVKKVQ
jgi:antitoxin component YwqK of YwqJK toxin-antitoxin module